jgi:hypothetical protein
LASRRRACSVASCLRRMFATGTTSTSGISVR